MKLIEHKKVQANQRVWSIDWYIEIKSRHPQGQALISAGSTKNIAIWRYQNQSFTKQSEIITQHSKTIRCVKFSNKGDKIAVASFDATITVWVFNSENKQYQMLSTLQGHQNEVKCVSWSPNDQKIASCSRDKNIWIWDFDATSYDYVCDSVLQGHTQDVKFVSWFPNQDGKIVSSSYDNTIRIWQSDDDDYVCKQVLQGHKSIVWSVKIYNKNLFSVSQDCTIIQWKLNQELEKYEKFQQFQGIHTMPIYTIQALNQKLLITGSGDNSINILSIENENGKENNISNVLVKVYHDSDVNLIKINPKKGNILASCSDDQTIRIWKLQNL